jgi:diguanylate cyclase (GGDEF)-like protein
MPDVCYDEHRKNDVHHANRRETVIESLSGTTEKIDQYRRNYLRWLSVLTFVATLVFMGLHFVVWHLVVPGIACGVYAITCVFVNWGTRQQERRLGLFISLFILASVALILTTIYFQTPEIDIDPWILACPVLAFVLCDRGVAALWSVLSLLGFLAVNQIAQFPAPVGSLVQLSLAFVTIAIGQYLYSVHLADVERVMVDVGNKDSLTDTLNRRSFREVLRSEFRRNLRQEVSMTVLMVDVDHFKRYNDHYGHVLGDRVLIRIAEALKQSARRPGDFVFRYGGEEFCILCSGVDPAQAASFAESLRACVDALQIEHKDAPLGRITVSVGYRHADLLAPLSPERLVEDADKALYLAKDRGRNRVETYLNA